MGKNSVISLADPVNNIDAVNKQYVDSSKPVIAIWAEEKGDLGAGEHQWAFGHSSGGGHQKYVGYIMPVSGRVIAMGLSATAQEALLTQE